MGFLVYNAGVSTKEDAGRLSNPEQVGRFEMVAAHKLAYLVHGLVQPDRVLAMSGKLLHKVFKITKKPPLVFLRAHHESSASRIKMLACFDSELDQSLIHQIAPAHFYAPGQGCFPYMGYVPEAHGYQRAEFFEDGPLSIPKLIWHEEENKITEGSNE